MVKNSQWVRFIFGHSREVGEPSCRVHLLIPRTYCLQSVVVGWVITDRTCCFVYISMVSDSAKSPIDTSGQVVKTTTSKFARFSVQVGSWDTKFRAPPFESTDDSAHHPKGKFVSCQCHCRFFCGSCHALHTISECFFD